MLRRIAIPLFAIAFAVSCASGDAAAQTIYKLIDKNGKVTYSEKPPKEFDGRVIRIDVDPNANTATFPKANARGEGARSETEGERIIRRKPDTGQEDRVTAARARLQAAEKAMTDARDTATDDDYMVIRNAGGGVRRVPNEQMSARLAGLEKAVKDAQEALEAAEKGPAL
jgi:hypothetical protein